MPIYSSAALVEETKFDGIGSTVERSILAGFVVSPNMAAAEAGFVNGVNCKLSEIGKSARLVHTTTVEVHWRWIFRSYIDMLWSRL